MNDAGPDDDPTLPAPVAPSLGRQISRAFMGVGFFKVYQMGMALLTSVILARVLGSEAYGSYSFIISMAAIIALPAYIGLPQLLVREVAIHESRSEWRPIKGAARWSHRLTLFIAIPSTCIVALVSYWNAGWSLSDKWTLLLLISPGIPFLALTYVRKALLQGLRKIQFANAPDLLARPTVFIVLIVSLWMFGGLNQATAIAGQVIAIIGAFLLASLLLATARPSNYSSLDSGTESRQWFRALIPFSAIGVVGYLNTELFIPLLGILTGDEQVAYFRVALSLALLVALPLGIVESVIHPYVSRLYVDDDGRGLRKLVFWSGMAALLLSLPVVALVGLFGGQVLDILYGSEYAGAYWPLVIMAVAFALVNFVGPSMLLLHGTSFEKDAFVISLISLCGTLALSFLLIPQYGAIGGAVSFAVGKTFRALAFRAWAQLRLRALFGAKAIQ